MTESVRFYDISKLMEKGCDYSIAIGQRSNGKTYSALSWAIRKAYASNSMVALVRRWKEDLTGTNAESVCNAFDSAKILEWTSGEWDSIYFKSPCWYWARSPSEEHPKPVRSELPFMQCFAITQQEHYKGVSYPRVQTIVFDEFLTNRGTIANEPVNFLGLVSTLVRARSDVRVVMLGNTVQRQSPYFSMFGIDIDNLRQGTIETMEFDSGCSLAIEYCSAIQHENAKLFSFNNPRLSMITTGAWETPLYATSSLDEMARKFGGSSRFFGNPKNLGVRLHYGEKSVLLFALENAENRCIYAIDGDSKFGRSVTASYSLRLVPTTEPNTYRHLGNIEDPRIPRASNMLADGRIIYDSVGTGEVVSAYLRELRDMDSL